MLLVEDEPALASAVVECLADAGYVVTMPRTARRGSTPLRARTFDAIICDLKMPRLDGPAFYRALVEDYPALARRVIFVTGDVAGTEAERFLESKAAAAGCPSRSGCRRLAARRSAT